ncbi:hypothetical protein ZWY2020_030150 [Hordeum vulgare]|nr:hypothetical protein ZWY2020_030150 [Hordeum vulgare]
MSHLQRQRNQLLLCRWISHLQRHGSRLSLGCRKRWARTRRSGREVHPSTPLGHGARDEPAIPEIQMQMGVMSPTKLRMHLLGMGSSHGYGGANKDEAPSKSPPSRLDVDDHPKNSLLPQEPDQGSSSEYPKDRSDSSSSRSCSNGSHGR